MSTFRKIKLTVDRWPLLISNENFDGSENGTVRHLIHGWLRILPVQSVCVGVFQITGIADVLLSLYLLYFKLVVVVSIELFC